MKLSALRLLRALLPLTGCLALAVQAEERQLTLQTRQLQYLGVEIAKVDALGNGRGNRLPARVTVPNAQMRVLAAPVAGVVVRLAVAPGDSVRRGQKLAELASPQALDLQRDALQSASQAGLLQQNLKRDEQLYAEGLIAESRLQATRAAAAQAGAQAEQGRRALALNGLPAGQLGGALSLTAPLDGVVLEQGAQLGQRVEASAPIYTIARLNPLWLEIQAPVEVAATLRVGQSLRVANGSASGRLTAIGRAVEAASQGVLLRAEVTAGADSLRPGQVCEVEIAGGDGHLIGLPAAALARLDGQPVVFVENGSDKENVRFTVRPVRVVAQGGDRVTVDGLRGDERLAVRGVSGLKALASGIGGE